MPSSRDHSGLKTHVKTRETNIGKASTTLVKNPLIYKVKVWSLITLFSNCLKKYKTFISTIASTLVKTLWRMRSQTRRDSQKTQFQRQFSLESSPLLHDFNDSLESTANSLKNFSTFDL